MKQELSDAIIAHLTEGDLEPAELCSQLGLSLRELAQWVNESGNIRLLGALAYMADVRAQMLLARYRASAAAQLIAIATSREPSELSRKACVDLLSSNLDVFAQQEPEKPEAPPAPSEEAILEALEQLGSR